MLLFSFMFHNSKDCRSQGKNIYIYISKLAAGEHYMILIGLWKTIVIFTVNEKGYMSNKSLPKFLQSPIKLNNLDGKHRSVIDSQGSWTPERSLLSSNSKPSPNLDSQMPKHHQSHSSKYSPQVQDDPIKTKWFLTTKSIKDANPKIKMIILLHKVTNLHFHL